MRKERRKRIQQLTRAVLLQGLLLCTRRLRLLEAGRRMCTEWWADVRMSGVLELICLALAASDDDIKTAPECRYKDRMAKH